MNRILAILILQSMMVHTVRSQDIHFSQFARAPLNLNPSYAGYFEGDYRFTAIHRNQWKSVTVPYTTFSGSFDMKIFPATNGHQFFSTGLVINNDRAGDSRYGTTEAGVAFSYIHSITEEHFLAIALQPSYSVLSLNYSRLTFDNQFDGDVFNPAIAPSETFANDQFSYADLAAGVNYHRISGRVQLGGGIALYHLLRPSYSFYQDSKTRMPIRFTSDIHGRIAMTEKFYLMPAVMFSFQEKFREQVLGSHLMFKINEKPGEKINLYAGLFARTGDAFIPVVGLDYNEWHLGISYDINTSDLRRASRGRGGYEIALTYLITRVKPFGIKPPCPVY
jgi:type IX secretion system PorP/SprF family membrane protein